MRTIRRSRARATLVAFLTGLVAVGGVIVTGQSPAAADVNQVSGSAFALSLDALGLITIPPTPAGVSGSANEVTNSYDTGLQVAVPVAVPGVLSVGVLEAQSRGGDVTGLNHFGFAESDARTANVVVGNILLPALQAQVIRSECRSDGDGSTGLTELIGASAGGSPIVQTPAANTPLIIGNILAPIATAILNEQTVVNVPGVSTSIVVNAIHITVLPGLLPGSPAIDIVIGQSACAAQGPDVLIPDTTTTGVTPTTGVPPTTGAPPTTGGGGNNNNNNNNNSNNNNNDNQNSNQNDNSNTNTIVNNITNINVINDDNENANENENEAGRGGGGGGGDHDNGDDNGDGNGDGHEVELSGARAAGGTLARTGSEVGRVVTLAFLALVLGGLFVLGGLGLTAESPSTTRRRRGVHRKREVL